MKIVEIIKISKGILELLAKYDIQITDIKYLGLFSDYEQMLANGEKTTYIVEVLAERYRLSVSSVYRILKRFKITV